MEDIMQKWRDGEISDGEVMRELLLAMATVQEEILRKETIQGEQRMERLVAEG